MRKSLQAIVLVKNLSTGILAPVLTLALLAHGATLGELPLLIGLYSFTVIAAEFPSGVFADAYGRVTAFAVSALCSLGGYITLLLARGPAPLAAAMVLQGLGRAFSSGSIDALAIDEAQGPAALVGVTSRLAVLESVGLSLGALAGGGLSGVGVGYAGNLGVNIALTALLLVLALSAGRRALRGHTAPPHAVGGKAACERQTLRALVADSLRFAARPGLVRALLMFAVVTGFAMLGVETYWQPALTGFAPPAWLFGVVSFAGFGSVMLGSKLAAKLLGRAPRAGLALLFMLKALLGASLLALSAAQGAGAFAGVYALGYLLLGGAGVVESTLLNREAPSGQRASILSLFSFTLQIGGLAASLTGYLLSAGGGYRALWLISGGLLMGLCALLWLKGAARSGAKDGEAACNKASTTLGCEPQADHEAR